MRVGCADRVGARGWFIVATVLALNVGFAAIGARLHADTVADADVVFGQVGGDLDGEAAFDDFGRAVALSADGGRVAVGAPGHDIDGKENVGRVQVFEWDGSSWTQVGVSIDGEFESEIFGRTLALSADGHRLAVSSFGRPGRSLRRQRRSRPGARVRLGRFGLDASRRGLQGARDHW